MGSPHEDPDEPHGGTVGVFVLGRRAERHSQGEGVVAVAVVSVAGFCAPEVTGRVGS